MKKRYHEIVFLQGEEAGEALTLLDEESEQACLEYLAQWDYGDSPAMDTPPWGEDDDLYRDGNYVLSYNSRIGYVGLCRVISE